MPTLTCLTLATGGVSLADAAGAAPGVAARAVRSPAMMNAIPPMKSATLIANSQFTVFIKSSLTPLRRHTSVDSRAVCSYGAPLLVEEPFIQNRKQDQRQRG